MSPQFTDSPEPEGRIKKRRRLRELDLGEQLPDLQPSRTHKRKKPSLSLRRKEQGCARTRIWNKSGVVAASQHISLFPSASSLHTLHQQCPSVSAFPNPPPPPVDFHLPSSDAHIQSANSISDNSDDLHNRAIERTLHATDSGDTSIPSTAAENPVSLESSNDSTYLEDCSGQCGGVLKTAKDSVDEHSTVGERCTPKVNAADREVESRNGNSNIKKIAQEDSTEEESPSILQALLTTSQLSGTCPFTRLTPSDVHSPVGAHQPFVSDEFETRHDAGVRQGSRDIHTPSLPLPPTVSSSNQQGTEPWLKAHDVENTSCPQQDTCEFSCVSSSVHSSFTLNLGDLVADTPAGEGQGRDGCSDDSTHLSESPVTMPESVDQSILKCRDINKCTSSGSERLYKACNTADPSQCQRYNYTPMSHSPKDFDSDFHGLEDVIPDSVDSTRPSLLRLEVNQSMEIRARDLSIRVKDTQTVCDLQRFQPPSFSTPFQSIDKSLDASGTRLNLRSNQPEWESRRHEERSNNSKDDGDVTDNSLTRLDSHWALNLSTTTPSKVPTNVDFTTPSRGAGNLLPNSACKSILKKRKSISTSLDSCDGVSSSGQHFTNRRPKFVTFNLSYNSNLNYDNSSVLAKDTPKHLWCSISSLPDHEEDKIMEGYVDSEDVCIANSHKENVEEIVCGNLNNWQGPCSLDDVCLLAMDTPVHMWASPSIKFIDDTF